MGQKAEWPSEILQDENIIPDKDGAFIRCIICSNERGKEIKIRMSIPFQTTYWRSHSNSNRHKKIEKNHLTKKGIVHEGSKNSSKRKRNCTSDEDSSSSENITTTRRRQDCQKGEQKMKKNIYLKMSGASDEPNVVVPGEPETVLTQVTKHTPWNIVLELLEHLPQKMIIDFLKNSPPDVIRDVELHFQQSTWIMEATDSFWFIIHPKGREGYWTARVAELYGKKSPSNNAHEIVRYAKDIVTVLECHEKVPPLDLLINFTRLHTVRVLGNLPIKEWIILGKLITHHTCINTLYVGKNHNITADTTEILRSLFQMGRSWHLELNECDMTIPAAFMLAHLIYALVSLRIASTTVPCLGLWVKAIWQTSKMHTVALCRTGLTVEHFKEDVHNPTEHSITSLDIQCNETMKSEGIQGMLTALGVGNMGQLKRLKLCATSMGGEGTTALREAMARNQLSNVEVLEMQMNRIPGTHLLKMVPVMLQYTKIHSLDLSFNSFGNDLLPLLLVHLAPTVKRLKFRGNELQVTPEVLTAFESNLCPQLLYLSLSSNPLGNDGVVALVNCLSRGSPDLQVLNIMQTGLTHAGLSSIQGMFIANQEASIIKGCWPKQALNVMHNALEFPEAYVLLQPWAPSHVFCNAEHSALNKSMVDWLSY